MQKGREKGREEGRVREGQGGREGELPGLGSVCRSQGHSAAATRWEAPPQAGLWRRGSMSAAAGRTPALDTHGVWPRGRGRRPVTKPAQGRARQLLPPRARVSPDPSPHSPRLLLCPRRPCSRPRSGHTLGGRVQPGSLVLSPVSLQPTAPRHARIARRSTLPARCCTGCSSSAPGHPSRTG